MTQSEREDCIARIGALPAQLRELIADATDEELARPYRPGGWTSFQVIHHLADSHMNMFVRAHLILTEDNPPLKPYDQDEWAKLTDAAGQPVEPSLRILDGVHARLTSLYRSLPEQAWKRTAYHPERGPLSLESLLTLYANHGEKHLGHIRQGIGR
jgi:hypothetical protein